MNGFAPEGWNGRVHHEGTEDTKRDTNKRKDK
jgi:hypothetical protein